MNAHTHAHLFKHKLLTQKRDCLKSCDEYAENAVIRRLRAEEREANTESRRLVVVVVTRARFFSLNSCESLTATSGRKTRRTFIVRPSALSVRSINPSGALQIKNKSPARKSRGDGVSCRFGTRAYRVVCATKIPSSRPKATKCTVVHDEKTSTGNRTEFLFLVRVVRTRKTHKNFFVVVDFAGGDNRPSDVVPGSRAPNLLSII